MRITAIVSAIVVLAVLLLAPAFIEQGIGKSIYEVNEDKKLNRFEGKIELWHIVSFKTPKGSGYSLIKERMKALQSSLPYVYINVKGLTLEEANELIMQGEMPDVVSYPQGFALDMPCLGLDDKAFVFADSASAYPYMADAYTLVVNNDLITDMSFNAGLNGYASEQFFLSAYEKNGLAVSGVSDEAFYSIMQNILLDNTNEILLNDQPSISIDKVKPTTDIEGFKEEQTALMLCPYSAYIKLIESKEGEKMNLTAYDISSYTDLVQYLSAVESEDESKNEVLTKICNTFVSARTQLKVCELGMFPSIPVSKENIERLSTYDSLDLQC